VQCRMDPLLMTLLSKAAQWAETSTPLPRGLGATDHSPAALDKIFRTGHPDARTGPLDEQLELASPAQMPITGCLWRQNEAAATATQVGPELPLWKYQHLEWGFSGHTDETVFSAWVSQSKGCGPPQQRRAAAWWGVSLRKPTDAACEWAEPRVLYGLGLRSETDTGGCCQ